MFLRHKIKSTGILGKFLLKKKCNCKIFHILYIRAELLRRPSALLLSLSKNIIYIQKLLLLKGIERVFKVNKNQAALSIIFQLFVYYLLECVFVINRTVPPTTIGLFFWLLQVSSSLLFLPEMR